MRQQPKGSSKTKLIKTILISLSDSAKAGLQPLIHALVLKNGRVFYATKGTKQIFDKINIPNIKLAIKVSSKGESEIEGQLISELINNKEIDLIINIPSGDGGVEKTDGQLIRELAKQNKIPVIKNQKKAIRYLADLINS